MINDISVGDLLFLDEKSKFINYEGDKVKTFWHGGYCIYLGFCNKKSLHLFLYENEIFKANIYNLMTKSFIIQTLRKE